MIDFSKPIQTRDGRKARIIATDAAGDYPVIALIADATLEREVAYSYTAEGGFDKRGEKATDLINVPETVSGHYWVNIYKNDDPCAHRTREAADRGACTNRLACIEWVFVVQKGTGL